jgi:glycosyltransferase involved in cell wall biosynthesis
MATALTVHEATWRLVDHFLPVSEAVAEHLIDAGVPPDRVTVRPNPVRDQGPAPGPGEGFLFAARLDPEKGLGLLLDAWKHAALGTRTTLVIAGEGPERARAEAAAATVPGVRYVGPVDRAGVRALMEAAACVVVPSLWPETFGRTAVEAFAAARPVIATDLGGLATTVTPDVGWSVPARPESLAGALDAALAPEVAAAKGARARDRYTAVFSCDRVMQQLLDIYAEVDATRRPRV